MDISLSVKPDWGYYQRTFVGGSGSNAAVLEPLYYTVCVYARHALVHHYNALRFFSRKFFSYSFCSTVLKFSNSVNSLMNSSFATTRILCQQIIFIIVMVMDKEIGASHTHPQQSKTPSPKSSSSQSRADV